MKIISKILKLSCILAALLQSSIIQSPMKPKTAEPTGSFNNQPAEQEEIIIQEIKSLLKDGKVPSLGFTQWVDSHGPVLVNSKKKSIATLGETLTALRQGNTSNISAFDVLPNFEHAVQEYDKKFRISTLSKPVIIAKGTWWYFSGPQKK